jgi:hypothetical protein
MAFSTARILSKDGTVIAENIEIWIAFFHRRNQEVWDGSFEVPITTPLTYHTYRIQLSDGREGRITNLTTMLRGDNIAIFFEGSGPLQ